MNNAVISAGQRKTHVLILLCNNGITVYVVARCALPRRLRPSSEKPRTSSEPKRSWIALSRPSA